MRFITAVLLMAVSAISVEAVIYGDCISRILSAKKTLNAELKKLKEEIDQTISFAKSTYNHRGDAIKSEIRDGPEKCAMWLPQIDSALNSTVNSMYAFTPCEKTAEVNELARSDNKLEDIRKSVQNWNQNWILENCVSSAGMIQNNVVWKSAQILAATKSCVDGITKSAEVSLDQAYDYWKRCTKP